MSDQPAVVILIGLVLIACALRLDWWVTRRHRDAQDQDVATTKRCPECFGKCLIHLPSMNAKLCADCHTEFPWHLTEGQVQTLAPSRATRKVKPQ